MKGQGSGKETAAPKLTRKKLEALLSAEFPQMFDPERGYAIERVWLGGCRLRRHFHPKSLRPGGTVSGPIIMALADVAMYVAVLSAIGWVPLAVTTNLTINFLRKPAPRDLLLRRNCSSSANGSPSAKSAFGRRAATNWWPTPP